MARPTTQGIDYFPLDVNFDSKTNLYMLETGPTGLAVLVTIWQLIYKDEGYYIEVKDLPLIIRSRINADINSINVCINSLIDRNIFDKHLFEKGILTSKAIQKRFFDAAKRKKKIKVIEEFLLIDVNAYHNLVNVYNNSVNVNINATNVDVDVNKELKEELKEKIKEKEKEKEKEKKEKEKEKEILSYESNFTTPIPKSEHQNELLPHKAKEADKAIEPITAREPVIAREPAIARETENISEPDLPDKAYFGNVFNINLSPEDFPSWKLWIEICNARGQPLTRPEATAQIKQLRAVSAQLDISEIIEDTIKARHNGFNFIIANKIKAIEYANNAKNTFFGKRNNFPNTEFKTDSEYNYENL